MKPSIFSQLAGSVQVGTRLLKPSPRHWNPGLLLYKERLWLCYRYHLTEDGGRCATAIVELDRKTWQPVGESQRVPLPEPTKTEHHEDARLFLFKGDPHISYSEMIGYRPGHDYRCVMKYAKLRLRGGKWEVVKTHQPEYGDNTGYAKEKNWVFFEHDGTLHTIYANSPVHKVLKLDGHKVVEVFESPAAIWHFGAVRGGTTPVRLPDGSWLTLFHSSVPTEIPPHYVRYYAGGYVFSGQPPFHILQISTKPVMVGSEADGHKTDPRYEQGWKPFVVFPCGLVEEPEGFVTSVGVNDWMCAVAKVDIASLSLGAPDGSDIKPRYFKTTNGSMPAKVWDEFGKRTAVEWIIPRARMMMAPLGYMTLANPSQAQDVADTNGVEEISKDDFDRATAAGSRLRRF